MDDGFRMMLNLSREIPCGYSDGELKGKTEGDGGWESEQILRDRRKEKEKRARKDSFHIQISVASFSVVLIGG